MQELRDLGKSTFRQAVTSSVMDMSVRDVAARVKSWVVKLMQACEKTGVILDEGMDFGMERKECMKIICGSIQPAVLGTMIEDKLDKVGTNCSDST